jgi:hypothetical protein
MPDTDSDSDGTADCQDQCPEDAGKTAPGECGCGQLDVDSDTDGEYDCDDECPFDADKTLTGVCGCSVAETDSDSDGTLDCDDGCAGDPDKTAPGACGCTLADTDSDSDETADCNDECPSDALKILAGACGCGVAETDTDNDATPDCTDACPNDAPKTAAGSCGCSVPDTDSDADGTPDCNDACPSDAQKTVTGTCGCGMVDTDADADGTPDCHDGCPADASKTSSGACGCAVADMDSDQDGTPDCHDSCPSDATKSSAGICGCGVLEDAADSDGDQVPNCLDLCEGNDENGDSDGDGVCDTGAVQLLLETSEFTDARGPCAEGGSELHFGLDADASGELEEPEIASISYLCAAAGAPAIAFSSAPLDEAPPACPNGAFALELGIDSDGNGSLDGMEVQATHVLCADMAAPVNLSRVPADESACMQGGIELSSGVDLNDDLTIDGDERTAISRICTGSAGFTLSLPLEASSNCPQGGVRLARSVGGEADGELDTHEFKSAVDVCAGVNLLAVSTELEPGSRECPDGGTKLRAGTDRDLNGMLDASEVTASETICNDVTQPVHTAALPADSIACPDSGVIVSVGDIPNLTDGSTAMETSYTHTACHGEHALLDFRKPASNSTSCETDPVHVTIGVDRDGDGKLDSAEAASSEVICPGTDTPVTRSRQMPASPQRCPDGGLQVESGLDRDGSGTLDDSEVNSWQWSCDGDHLTVKGTALPGRSPQCKDGGVVLESGEDKDGNHVIDSDERWGSDVICGTTPLLVEVQTLGLADGCLSGTRVSAGPDDGSSGGVHGDGALQSGEIRVTQQQCTGDDGCAVMIVTHQGSRSAVTLLWAALGLLFAVRRRRRRDKTVVMLVGILSVALAGSARAQDESDPKQAELDTLSSTHAAVSGSGWGGRGTDLRTFEFGVLGGGFIPSSNHELYDIDRRTVRYQKLAKVAPEFGLRAGYLPLGLLAVELELALMPAQIRTTSDAADVWAVRGQAVLQAPTKTLVPFALAGLGALGVVSKDAALGSDVDAEMHLGIGAKAYFVPALAVRLDVRDNISPGLGKGVLTQHWEVLAGVSFVLGRSTNTQPSH